MKLAGRQAAGKKGFGVGMVKDDPAAIVKCALPCCTYGLIKPSVCSASTGECLCIKSAASFPFKEGFVPSLMCTICFIQCVGESGAGILKEPPKEFVSPGAVGGDAPVANPGTDGAPVADMER
jgi:hypothetical protein